MLDPSPSPDALADKSPSQSPTSPQSPPSPSSPVQTRLTIPLPKLRLTAADLSMRSSHDSSVVSSQVVSPAQSPPALASLGPRAPDAEPSPFCKVLYAAHEWHPHKCPTHLEPPLALVFREQQNAVLECSNCCLEIEFGEQHLQCVACCEKRSLGDVYRLCAICGTRSVSSFGPDAGSGWLVGRTPSHLLTPEPEPEAEAEAWQASLVASEAARSERVVSVADFGVQVTRRECDHWAAMVQRLPSGIVVQAMDLPSFEVGQTSAPLEKVAQRYERELMHMTEQLVTLENLLSEQCEQMVESQKVYAAFLKAMRSEPEDWENWEEWDEDELHAVEWDVMAHETPTGQAVGGGDWEGSGPREAPRSHAEAGVGARGDGGEGAARATRLGSMLIPAPLLAGGGPESAAAGALPSLSPAVAQGCPRDRAPSAADAGAANRKLYTAEDFLSWYMDSQTAHPPFPVVLRPYAGTPLAGRARRAHAVHAAVTASADTLLEYVRHRLLPAEYVTQAMCREVHGGCLQLKRWVDDFAREAAALLSYARPRRGPGPAGRACDAGVQVGAGEVAAAAAGPATGPRGVRDVGVGTGWGLGSPGRRNGEGPGARSPRAGGAGLEGGRAWAGGASRKGLGSLRASTPHPILHPVVRQPRGFKHQPSPAADGESPANSSLDPLGRSRRARVRPWSALA